MECSICLNEICGEKESRDWNIRSIKLKCGHCFHYKCMWDWHRISRNTLCPYCRTNFSERESYFNKICDTYSKKFIHPNINRYFSGKVFKYTINPNNSIVSINIINNNYIGSINFSFEYDNLISIMPFSVNTEVILGHMYYKIYYKIFAKVNGIDTDLYIDENTRCILLNSKVLFQSREIKSKFGWKKTNDVLKMFCKEVSLLHNEDITYLKFKLKDDKIIRDMVTENIDCFTISVRLLQKCVPNYIQLLTNTNFICMLNDIYVQKYAKVEYLDHKCVGKYTCLLFMLKYFEYDTTEIDKIMDHRFDREETIDKELIKLKKHLSYSKRCNLVPLRLRYNEK
jgi:hypothetical protein